MREIVKNHQPDTLKIPHTCKGVNHLANGPLESSRVQRHPKASKSSWLASEEERKRLQDQMEQKHKRMVEDRAKLKTRLQEGELKRQEAFRKKALSLRIEKALENHAPKRRQRQQKKMIKQLSSESLEIVDIPPERTYFVFPEEKYDLNLQYFPIQQIHKKPTVKDPEKELRMSYRAGHLDEIKRRQFGKVFDFTRRHYMEQELKSIRK